MHVTPQNTFFRRVLLPLGAGLLFVTTILLLAAAIAPSSSPITSTLAAYAQYDPSTYGIPYEIAGYKVLAVMTSANTACIPSGAVRVIVQLSQPDIHSFLANSGAINVVRETLQRLPLLANVHIDLEFIGSRPWNAERFMSSNATRNKLMKNGCIKLGPAIIITLTPVPDPFISYDPLTYDIPEIMAGYRILTVQTPENTRCMPPSSIHLTIQAVDPSSDNPMIPRDFDDIIAELKKLNPHVQWELTYVMPTPFDRQQFLFIIQNYNQATKNGCIKTGGPIAIVTNTP